MPPTFVVIPWQNPASRKWIRYRVFEVFMDSFVRFVKQVAGVAAAFEHSPSRVASIADVSQNRNRINRNRIGNRFSPKRAPVHVPLKVSQDWIDEKWPTQSRATAAAVG